MGTHYRGSPAEVRALDACIKLVRAASTLRERLERASKSAGLTESQLGVLEALLHLGPLQQHEIGAKLLVSRANVTLLADRLADLGLVRREREVADRRCIRVHLTPAGRRRIVAVFPGHVARIVAALSVLSAKEQVELGRLCRKLGLALAVE
jgi:MarR family 2-MHQ and catechol resistance regulon transcriptional repressor